ncbi:MAG: molybdopterin-dependent oxidoreductase [Candidatus Aramenus sp.]|jgi:carbon-monoxide dehydrogenase large subunit|nr:molybdopterin-dependent oxidoreductase [Candidatus Aramenus sp.]
MRWNLVYVDDLGGDYKYVGFKRSTEEHAKFYISGNCYAEDYLHKYAVDYLFGDEGAKLPKATLLAREKALYEGHPLCVAVAEERYEVEDKLDQVEVEYTPVEGPLYPEVEDNVILSTRSDPLIDGEGADLEFSMELRIDRSSPAPMEPRVVAVRHYGDTIVVHASTQAPTVARLLIAKMLDVPAHKVKVEVPQVGGGFGAKQDLSYEELAVVALAYELGENLKWVENRSEHVQGSQARDQRHKLLAKYTKDGKLVYLFDEITYDLGAFPLPWTGFSPLFVTLGTMTSLYSFNFSYNAKVVVSNKPPQGAYRGFGRPEAVFVMERIMEEISRRTGLDPIEVRRRNLRKDLEDVGDVEGVLRVLEQKYREYKEEYGSGVGVSLYVQYAGPNSYIMIEKEKSKVPGYDCVRAFLDVDGWLVIKVTATDQGQRMGEAIRKLVSRKIKYDKVKVVLGDNELKGFGVWASRTMLTMGNAAVLAARRIMEKVEELGGWESTTRTMLLEPWKASNLAEEVCYETDHFVGTISGQVSVVSLRNGKAKVEKHFVVADVGVTGDDDIVKGQLMGGALQGIGGSLYEDVNDGLEYSVPTAVEAPKFEVVLLHTPSKTPAGVRGVGENGPTGAYASVCNALLDLDLECKELPFKVGEVDL